MSFGMALAAGMGAFDAQQKASQESALADRQENRADEKWEETKKINKANLRNSDQQYKINNLQLKDATQAYKEKYSLEAKKGRVAKIKLNNQMLAEMTGAQQQTEQGAIETRQAQSEKLGMETAQRVADKEDVDNSVRAYGNWATTMNTAGRVTNFDELNTMIASNPVMGGLIKSNLVIYNPNDKKHKSGIDVFTSKLAEQYGAGEDDEAFALLRETVVDMADKGYLGFETDSGRPIDIKGIGTMMGLDKLIPESSVSGISKGVKAAGTAGYVKHARKMGLNEEPIWKKGSETGEGATSTGPKTYQGRDPSKYKMALEMQGMPIPQDLTDILKFNSNLINPTGKKGDAPMTGYWAGANPIQIEEAVGNQVTEILADNLKGADADTLIARAKSGIALLDASDSVKNKLRARVQTAEDSIVADDIVFKKEALSNSEQSTIDIMENNNLDTKAHLVKKQEKVLSEYKLTVGIDDVMETIIDVEKGAGMSNEVLASSLMQQAIGIAPDMAADLLAKLKDTSKDVSREMINNTIAVNSKLGKILATYVKNTSGAAVSDQERQFLSNILMGAAGGDSKTMLIALSTFKEASQGELKEMIKNKSLVAGIPATMRRVQEGISSSDDYIAQYDKIKAQKAQQDGQVDIDPATTKQNPAGISPDAMDTASKIDFSK